MPWRLRTMQGVEVKGQPAQGFDGPGKVYLWAKAHGYGPRFGRDLFVVSDDGARPYAGVNLR